MLIDREWRKRQFLKQAAKEDGLAAQAKEASERKREEKKKLDDAWEQGREQRVSGWRNFLKGAKDSKKKKRTEYRMPKSLVVDEDKTYIKRVKTAQTQN